MTLFVWVIMGTFVFMDDITFNVMNEETYAYATEALCNVRRNELARDALAIVEQHSATVSVVFICKELEVKRN